MGNELEFSAPAHSLLMKTEAVHLEHQENKNRSASIQASLQAARKKRYTKLNFAILASPRANDDLNERRRTTPRRIRRGTSSEKRDRSVPRPPGIDSIMLERPLSLVSLNVRGLRGDTPKPKEIKALMASFVAPPQILFI
ncbi:unnamed protein product [Sphagnum troendelagicum]|uniref:Uncharacterized protein n=1 Tax=Sphagnum troendelagicum TaxID=128251 RepID=A0ABP0TP30_9BRYO